MKNKSGLDWRARIEGVWNPEIHPEDLVTAIRAKMLASADPVAFAEAALLDSLCGHPERPWSDGELKAISERKGDAKFFLALSRGFVTPRKPTLNDLELVILKGWREVKMLDESFPGFRNWSPRAATCALQANGILAIGDHRTTYVDARKALDLNPGEIVVSDFNSDNGSGEIEITYKGGEKRILKLPR